MNCTGILLLPNVSPAEKPTCPIIMLFWDPPILKTLRDNL